MLDKKAIGNRIKQIRTEANQTQAQFAKLIKISRSALSQVESGTIAASLDVLNEVVRIANISYDYLISGSEKLQPKLQPKLQSKGENYPDEIPKATWLAGVSEIEEPYNRPPIQLNYPDTDSNTKLIPYIDTRAAAGLPASYENVTYWNDLPTVPVTTTDFKYGTFIAIQVAGDSMQPRLNPGDILFAKFLDNPQEDVRDNYVHIVVTREGTVVKRLLNRLKDKGFLTLKSDNPAYATYTEKHDSILQVWRVEAFTSFNLANPVASIYSQLNDHESRLAKIEKGTK